MAQVCLIPPWPHFGGFGRSAGRGKGEGMDGALNEQREDTALIVHPLDGQGGSLGVGKGLVHLFI